MSARQNTTPRARSLQVGEEFDRWTVDGPCEMVRLGRSFRPYYPCVCRCGTRKRVDGYGLIGRNNRSCGCLTVDSARKNNFRHGQSRTRLYYCWADIIARCEDPGRPGYKDYGARGIAMCREWRADFVAFRDWAGSHGYAKHLTIERIDVNGNYEPANCRWATPAEQGLNRRNNVILTAFGETKTMIEWTRDPRCAVVFPTLQARKARGWDDLECIIAPPDVWASRRRHQIK